MDIKLLHQKMLIYSKLNLLLMDNFKSKTKAVNLLPLMLNVSLEI